MNRPLRPPAILFWVLAAMHLVCPLLFFTDLTRNPYITQIALLNGGVWLMVLIYTVDALRQGRFTFWRTPLDVPLVLFLAAALLSWGLSWIDHPPFRLPIWNEGSRVTLFLIVNGLLVYWFSAQLKDPVWDRRLRFAVLFVGFAAGGYGILQYMGVEFIWPQALNPYSGRPVSSFGNPNFLSSYMIMLLPLCLAQGLEAKTSFERWGATALFLLFSGSVISTFTRSSWIGGAAGVLMFAFFARRQWKKHKAWALGAVLAAVLLAGFWPSSPLAGRSTRPLDRLTELYRGVTTEKSYGSWHQRLLIWSCALDMVKERPIVGKGWGCFELFYPFYQGAYLTDDVFRTFRTHANNAHNLLMEFWSQTGFLGLGIFLWICFLFFELARRRIPAVPESERLPAWAFLSAGAAMLVDNFFGNVSLFFAVPAFLFFWMMGSLGRTLSPSDVRVVPSRGWKSLVVCAALVLVSLWGIGHAYRYWRSEVDYFSGFKKAKQGTLKDSIDVLEKSVAVRRWEVNTNYELANAYARQSRWASDNRLPSEAKAYAEKALWAYDEALAANAGYDEIYFNRGTMQNHMGKRDEAVLSYRMSILINPLNAEAYKALGNLYLSREEDMPRAIELFSRALFFFPRDRDLWNNLGFLYTRSKENQKALDAFVGALKVDPHFDLAWKNFLIALHALGIKDHPMLKLPDLWAEMQKAIDQNRLPAARRAAEELAKLAPESVEVHLLLANICARSNAPDAALGNYRKVIAWEPGHGEARLNMGKVLLTQGRKAEAAQLFHALSLERPQDQEVRQLLLAAGPAALPLQPKNDLVE